jgi:hypothetical protein
VSKASLGIALAALVAALAAAGGFLAGARLASEPPVTRIELVACGIAPGPPPFELPLARILAETPGGVSLGPFALGGVAGPVTIRFEPLSEAEEKTARRSGSVVTLAVDALRHDRLDTITLRCRYGAPAHVAFRFGPECLELPVIADPEAPRAPSS